MTTIQIQSSSRAGIGSVVIDNAGFSKTPILAHGVAARLGATSNLYSVTLTQNFTVHLNAITHGGVSIYLATLQQYLNAGQILAQYPAVVERFNLHDAIATKSRYHVVSPASFSIQPSISVTTSSRYSTVISSLLSIQPAISTTHKSRQTLLDGIRSSASSVVGTRYHWVFSTPIFIQPSLVPGYNKILILAQSLALSFSSVERFTWGRALTQVFKVSGAAGVSGIYKKALAQLFRLGDIDGLSHTIPLILSQGINLSLVLAGGISLKLLQKLLVGTASLPAFTYHFTIAGRVVISDLIDKLFFVMIEQLFTMQPALGRQFIAGSSLVQLLAVSPAFTNKLVLRLNGNFQLSPEQLVNMLYKGDPLLDGVVITALYISPSGTTTTWAVNTRTNAVTEYLNYNFSSFAFLNGRYVASASTGLYELDGDTDDGALIISELMSGYLQFNEKKLFGIKGAYVAIRGGGRFYLKLISGDGREYIYELRAQPNMMSTKVRVGKGISTTYMAFDLVTEGQDFDIDSIEFIPMTRGRRV
jgi:hypothetical protein